MGKARGSIGNMCLLCFVCSAFLCVPVFSSALPLHYYGLPMLSRRFHLHVALPFLFYPLPFRSFSFGFSVHTPCFPYHCCASTLLSGVVHMASYVVHVILLCVAFAFLWVSYLFYAVLIDLSLWFSFAFCTHPSFSFNCL